MMNDEDMVVGDDPQAVNTHLVGDDPRQPDAPRAKFPDGRIYYTAVFEGVVVANARESFSAERIRKREANEELTRDEELEIRREDVRRLQLVGKFIDWFHNDGVCYVGKIIAQDYNEVANELKIKFRMFADNPIAQLAYYMITKLGLRGLSLTSIEYGTNPTVIVGCKVAICFIGARFGSGGIRQLTASVLSRYTRKVSASASADEKTPLSVREILSAAMDQFSSHLGRYPKPASASSAPLPPWTIRASSTGQPVPPRYTDHAIQSAVLSAKQLLDHMPLGDDDVHLRTRIADMFLQTYLPGSADDTNSSSITRASTTNTATSPSSNTVVPHPLLTSTGEHVTREMSLSKDAAASQVPGSGAGTPNGASPAALPSAPSTVTKKEGPDASESSPIGKPGTGGGGGGGSGADGKDMRMSMDATEDGGVGGGTSTGAPRGSNNTSGGGGGASARADESLLQLVRTMAQSMEADRARAEARAEQMDRSLAKFQARFDAVGMGGAVKASGGGIPGSETANGSNGAPTSSPSADVDQKDATIRRLQAENAALEGLVKTEAGQPETMTQIVQALESGGVVPEIDDLRDALEKASVALRRRTLASIQSAPDIEKKKDILYNVYNVLTRPVTKASSAGDAKLKTGAGSSIANKKRVRSIVDEEGEGHPAEERKHGGSGGIGGNGRHPPTRAAAEAAARSARDKGVHGDDDLRGEEENSGPLATTQASGKRAGGPRADADEEAKQMPGWAQSDSWVVGLARDTTPPRPFWATTERMRLAHIARAGLQESHIMLPDSTTEIPRIPEWNERNMYRY